VRGGEAARTPHDDAAQEAEQGVRIVTHQAACNTAVQEHVSRDVENEHAQHVVSAAGRAMHKAGIAR
jgi:hypothetical protein